MFHHVDGTVTKMACKRPRQQCVGATPATTANRPTAGVTPNLGVAEGFPNLTQGAGAGTEIVQPTRPTIVVIQPTSRIKPGPAPRLGTHTCTQNGRMCACISPRFNFLALPSPTVSFNRHNSTVSIGLPRAGNALFRLILRLVIVTFSVVSYCLWF